MSSSSSLQPSVNLPASSKYMKRIRDDSWYADDECDVDLPGRTARPRKLRDIERLSILCKSPPETEVKAYTSQSGETVSYIDFDDETWRALRTIFMNCPKKLIIRYEYEDALRYLERNIGKIGGFCVTGQPGIGKSLFLVYVLFLRLQKGLPTAFQTPDKRSYVLVEGKAYDLDDDDAPGLPSSLPRVWALSDSNFYTPTPTSLFQRHDFCIIQTTPPKLHRQKRWMKLVSAEVWIMDLWPEVELEALGDLCDCVTKESLLLLADQYGYSPRTILDLARNPHTQCFFVVNLINQIKRLVENPQSFFFDILEINITDDSSSNILHIQPAVVGALTSRSQPGVSIPSRFIASLIMDELAQTGAVIQADFFSRMNDFIFLRDAEWLYEAFIHTILMSQTDLPCTWFKSPAGAATPELITGVAPQSQNVSTRTRESLKTAKPPFYWRPRGRNRHGIEAVLCDGQGIFIIQTCATIDHRHPRPSPLAGISDFRKIVTESEVLRALPEHLLFVGQDEEDCEIMCATAAEYMTGQEWKNVSIGYCVVKMNRMSIFKMLSVRVEAK